MTFASATPGSIAAASPTCDALTDPAVADVADVLAACHTDLARGLTAACAAQRLARDGANDLRARPPVPPWRRALAQLQDPLVYLLLVAAAVALAAWLIEGRQGWPMDAIVIAVVVVLNAVLGWVQEAKARSAVAALARMTQATSGVVRDGQLLRIPASPWCWATCWCWPKATRWVPTRGWPRRPTCACWKPR
jgi:magnesium-transporting ATPase (P-type)